MPSFENFENKFRKRKLVDSEESAGEEYLHMRKKIRKKEKLEMLEVEKEEFMERKLVEKEEVGIGQFHHTLVVPEEQPASQTIADQKLLE